MEELDLRELIMMFWKRKVQIIVILLISAIIGIGYSYFIVKPNYESTTRVLLTQNVEVTEERSEVVLDSQLAPTYANLITTNSILETVVNNIDNPDITINNIKNNVSSENVENTEIVVITVKNANPDYAATIANEIAKVSCEKMVEIYDMSNTYILDKAMPSETPYNINHIRDIIIFIFIGVIVVCAYVLIANILGNTNNKK